MARYYLANIIGSGTETDPYRPEGLTADGQNPDFSMVDLRPTGSVSSGYCLLWLAAPDGVRRAVDLGDNPAEALSPGIRKKVGNNLGLTLATLGHVGDVAAELLVVHARTDGTRWKPLRRSRRRNRSEVWLGGLVWSGVSGGASLSESFDKADNGLGPDQTWNSLWGTTWKVVSNAGKCTVTSPSGGNYTAARVESDLDGDDHWAESDFAGIVNNNRVLVLVRMEVGTGDDSWYGGGVETYAQDTWEIMKFVNGSRTEITSAGTSGTGSFTDIRLEADGSSLTLTEGGSTRATGTDTDITGNTRCGMNTTTTDPTFDNWSAADVAAPGTAVQDMIGRGVIPWER